MSQERQGLLQLCEELDNSSVIPLYHQLKEIILDKIESGDWPEGFVIPSENDITRTCRISRATVRKAMELLAHEGFLEKKRGTGTFVRKPKIEEKLPQLKSFTEEMTGRNSRKQVLNVEYIEPTPRIKKILRLIRGEKTLYLKRLLFVDDVPIGILYEHVTGRLGLKLTEDYSGSLYKILEQYGVTIKEGSQVIESSLSTNEEAELMGLSEPFPTLVIKRTVFTGTGEPIEAVTGVYHGDRYRYKIRLSR